MVKPAYSTNRFGVSFTGSPSIPGLVKANPKQFIFLNVTGQRNTTPTNLYGTVPTDGTNGTRNERAGDFSGLTQTVNGVTVFHLRGKRGEYWVVWIRSLGSLSLARISEVKAST